MGALEAFKGALVHVEANPQLEELALKVYSACEGRAISDGDTTQARASLSGPGRPIYEHLCSFQPVAPEEARACCHGTISDSSLRAWM